MSPIRGISIPAPHRAHGEERGRARAALPRPRAQDQVPGVRRPARALGPRADSTRFPSAALTLIIQFSTPAALAARSGSSGSTRAACPWTWPSTRCSTTTRRRPARTWTWAPACGRACGVRRRRARWRQARRGVLRRGSLAVSTPGLCSAQPPSHAHPPCPPHVSPRSPWCVTAAARSRRISPGARRRVR